MRHRCNQSHEIRHVAARLLATGLTTRQVAEEIGRHRCTLWRWRRWGGLDAEVNRLQALARAEIVRLRVAGIMAGAAPLAGTAGGRGPGRCPVCGTRIGETRRD